MACWSLQLAMAAGADRPAVGSRAAAHRAYGVVTLVAAVTVVVVERRQGPAWIPPIGAGGVVIIIEIPGQHTKAVLRQATHQSMIQMTRFLMNVIYPRNFRNLRVCTRQALHKIRNT